MEGEKGDELRSIQNCEKIQEKTSHGESFDLWCIKFRKLTSFHQENPI